MELHTHTQSWVCFFGHFQELMEINTTATSGYLIEVIHMKLDHLASNHGVTSDISNDLKLGIISVDRCGIMSHHRMQCCIPPLRPGSLFLSFLSCWISTKDDVFVKALLPTDSSHSLTLNLVKVTKLFRFGVFLTVQVTPKCKKMEETVASAWNCFWRDIPGSPNHV